MLFFFFNDTATTEIYTLSLHDALPIYHRGGAFPGGGDRFGRRGDHRDGDQSGRLDRKSTRLNSSHSQISYAVFCLKKKNIKLSNCATHTPYTIHTAITITPFAIRMCTT